MVSTGACDPKRVGGDEITRVSHQNSSGTYVYFREAILGKGRDYKLGSIDQSGSKDVVALISNTPGTIGYSGMGYVTPGVKMLKNRQRRASRVWLPPWKTRRAEGAIPSPVRC